jgi:hypothetical protein
VQKAHSFRGDAIDLFVLLVLVVDTFVETHKSTPVVIVWENAWSSVGFILDTDAGNAQVISYCYSVGKWVIQCGNRNSDRASS